MKEKYRKPQINTAGLVAHYKLWAGLTSTALVFDYSLNGNAGTVSGAVPAYPGFGFSTNTIACGSGSVIDNLFAGGGTISIWLFTDGKGGGDAGTAITKEKWILQLGGDVTSMIFSQAFDGDDGIWTFAVTGGIWEHIIIVYDNDVGANNPIVYVDGVAVSATPATQDPGSDDATSDAADSLLFGDVNATGSEWDGMIGETMLFSRTLTSADAKSMYELTKWRYI